ncbi:GNAT family N-acetyltransferase [Actinoplanes derwentensis]|uniref:N-acetylglutamate synthase, GNAT family n=1 Tax=Actinoplanes derwentensis TaxID=113562 RepID=A0A1H2D472_9ACTN|nr:GNAT family N-acetyltransferase [Actinoplanes derwentensis]GID87969.1 N-acetyltransferase [Actinoplanes derwentensis]SDT77560.1 N-acetylglutamate synthase, GNAT family [Actinoplanes derwentensis]
MSELEIHQTRFDTPEVQKIVADAMAELARRYGGSGDDTPIALTDFDPPLGRFFIAVQDGEPVGCAGWRRHGDDAELKRMFTAEAARGRGVARRILAVIEESAREAGLQRVILETGDQQPEAIALYESRGYQRIEDFGHYRGHAGVLSFARAL